MIPAVLTVLFVLIVWAGAALGASDFTQPSAVNSVGTLLKYTATTDTSFASATTVGGVMSVTPSGIEIPMSQSQPIDATWDAVTPGRPSGGTVVIELVYRDTVWNALYVIAAARTRKLWRAVMTDGASTPSNYEFAGYIAGLTPPVSKDNETTTYTLTVRVSGTLNHNVST